MKMHSRSFAASFLLVLFGSTANAALLSRAGGQAYYDTVLDITWRTTASGFAGNYYDAMTWINSLNSSNYLGLNNWRLPIVLNTDGFYCDGSTYNGGECGYNVRTKSGDVTQFETGQTVYNEIAHLYYVTLANIGQYDTSGNNLGCHPMCRTNDGPFMGLPPSSGLPFWQDGTFGWDRGLFDMRLGNQGYGYNSNTAYAWAVSSGDPLNSVPIPAAVWLFGSALGAMGIVRRRAQSKEVIG
jgi:hypothetical protein